MHVCIKRSTGLRCTEMARSILRFDQNLIEPCGKMIHYSPVSLTRCLNEHFAVVKFSGRSRNLISEHINYAAFPLISAVKHLWSWYLTRVYLYIASFQRSNKFSRKCWCAFVNKLKNIISQSFYSLSFFPPFSRFFSFSSGTFTLGLRSLFCYITIQTVKNCWLGWTRLQLSVVKCHYPDSKRSHDYSDDNMIMIPI